MYADCCVYILQQLVEVLNNTRISPGRVIYFVYTPERESESVNLKILFMLYLDHASTCYLSIISISHIYITHDLTALERLGRLIQCSSQFRLATSILYKKPWFYDYTEFFLARQLEMYIFLSIRRCGNA